MKRPKEGDWVYYNNDASWLHGALGYIEDNLGTDYDANGNKLRMRQAILLIS
jgi:hypothetical protein